MKQLKRLITDRPSLVVGAGTFLYTAAAALFVQLLLLPVLFPGWHGGHGLLDGTDSLRFHSLAEEMASRIRQEGWSAWSLRPQGQTPAGIAAILYYVAVSEPWVMIPLHSLLHAYSAVVLLWIIRFFVRDPMTAVISVFPFAFYPSAMLWTTQFHKDGYSILGGFLILYGLLLLISRKSLPDCRLYIKGSLYILAGVFMLWLVRPYMVEIAQVIILSIAIFIVLIFSVRFLRDRSSLKRYLLLSVGTIMFAVFVFPFGSTDPVGEVVSITCNVFQEQESSVCTDSQTRLSAGPVQPDQVDEIVIEPGTWEWYDWIPDVVEGKIRSFAWNRDRYTQLNPDAMSNVDVDVSFQNVGDIIRYIPRALMISFLAPFPSAWFGQGSMPANTVMRRVSAFEMTGIYTSLLFLMYGMYHWRSKPELWVVLIWCTANLIVLGLVIANVGTLYRMRYGFLMVLVSLGAVSMARIWNDKKGDHYLKDMSG